MFLIIMLYGLFAVSVSASKVILGYTQPIFLVGIRMFVAGIILLSYQYFYAREQFRFQLKHIKYYAQIIVIGFYISYITRFWGLNYLSAPKAMFLYNLSPFLSSFYSYLMFGEKMTKKKWSGLLIGFIGFIPILLSRSVAEDYFGTFYFISLPEAAVLLSVITHSYSWIVVRKLVRDKSYSPMMVNSITMTCSGIMALITSFFVEGYAPVSDVMPFIGLLALIIFVSNIICHNLYGFLLKTYTATFVSFAGFIGPLFAALYGWVLWGENITWHFYVSTIIVLAGLYLFYKDELSTKDILPSKSMQQQEDII